MCPDTLMRHMTLHEMYTGQQSIEKDLANLLTLKDSQVRFIKAYHKTILLPSMVALNTLLSDHASSVTSLGVDIITKVEFLQDSYVTHATRQADALQKLGEEVEMMAPQHSNLLMRGHDLARRLHANAETFVRVMGGTGADLRQGNGWCWSRPSPA
ncbi:hypothetical protein FHG87_022750 [Trinorchestia longiramus]|nr:hypothetical protein FHG87_022750 [Trinorchestia longiramus]